MTTTEVVCKPKRCREVVRELKKCDVVSVDAEGINLGKEGPLTLLQIGTKDGQVYLFDVCEHQNLLSNGRVKDILESENIVKVMHSSRGDSAALYFQFDIQLQNVFDTQIAHLVIEEHKGRKLPPCIKLEEVCRRYSDTGTVSDQKDAVKEIYANDVGHFWAIRPLTEDMIAYASGDVTALIPEVYERQKEYLEQFKLLPKFYERTKEEVNMDIDKAMSKQRYKRQQKITKSIVDRIPDKYPATTTYDEITDEDDIAAIRKTKFNAKNLHPFVKQLRTEAIQSQLQDLDNQICDDENNFIPKSRSYIFLKNYEYHSDEEIKRDAKRISKTIYTIILENMARKYKPGTCTDMLAVNEKEALNTLRPKGVRDREINPFLLNLYWQMKEDNLDGTIERFKEKQEDYVIPEKFYKWIKYCCSGRVPQQMKTKARRLVRNFDRIFGKGIVPGRQSESDDY